MSCLGTGDDYGALMQSLRRPDCRAAATRAEEALPQATLPLLDTGLSCSLSLNPLLSTRRPGRGAAAAAVWLPRVGA